MAVTTVYSNALSGFSPFGQNFNYAVALPAPNVSGGAIRLTLKAGPSGSLPMADIWVGHKGTGAIDFDGGQVHLGSATVGAGSEIRLTAEMPVVSGKPLLLIYDAMGASSGRQYAYADTAGMSMYYRTGLGGASNGDTSRVPYPNLINNRTAVVSKIEVADSLADFSAPPAQPTDPGTSGISAALAGELFASGTRFDNPIAPVSGQYLHLIMNNPSVHQVRVAISEIRLRASADVRVMISALSNLPAGVVLNDSNKIPSSCNVFFSTSSLPSKAKLHYFWYASPQGAQHFIDFLDGQRRTSLTVKDAPLAIADAGQYALLTFLSPGVTAEGSFFWHELPIT